MSAFEGMVVLMFLAKTSGFVLKEPGAVFAEGQSFATCQRFRDHWGLLEAEFLCRNEW